MSKIKQKLSKKFQSSPTFHFQNWLELWSKDSVDNFVKNFIHFQDKTTENVIHKTKKVADGFYAQKAVQNNADENLPFKTLVLLGKKLTHPAYREDIKLIIENNIIKFNGVFYKLNDLEHQKKIQNAIEKYQFEECKSLNEAA